MFFKLKCYMQEFFCSEKMTCITSPKKNVLVLCLHPRYNNFSTRRSLKKWDLYETLNGVKVHDRSPTKVFNQRILTFSGSNLLILGMERGRTFPLI